MTLEVKFASEADLGRLRERDNHISPEWVERCVGDREYIVAYRGQELVGFLRYSWFWRSIPYMELIEVAAQHRRAGVGSALLAFWQEAMVARKARMLMTSSVADELEPLTWHRRNGFTESGVLEFGPLQAAPEVFLTKSV
jgi:ribosomal protein S18 acetylase RimI-like enzyme